VAKSAAELIRELTTDFRVQEERLEGLQDEMNQRKAADEKRREENIQLRRELAEARQENAVLRQQFQDHLTQYQEWDRRRWGLIVMVFGAMLTSVLGFIVALARK
jgi:chromosome segregation ATPase